jgi:predicted lipoprotein
VAELLGDVGPQVILPALQDFAVEVDALDAALLAWAEDIQEDPTRIAAQTASQEQWARTMQAWQRLELMQIGPAASSLKAIGGQDLRDEIYSWPSVNGCRIDQKTADGSWIDGDFFDATLVNAYGLDALEYLLFGGLDCLCPPQVNPIADGSWEAMGDAGVLVARANYSSTLIKEISRVTDILIEAWSPDGGNFGAMLTRENDESPIASQQEALNAVFEALFYLETETKDRKLAHPMGEKDCNEAHCAEDLEGLTSGETLAMLHANVEGFEALFRGGEGVGFEELLQDLGHGDLAQSILLQAQETKQALVDFEGDLFDAIVDGATSAQDLLAHFSMLTDEIKQDMVTVLSLVVPSEAAGDND